VTTITIVTTFKTTNAHQLSTYAYSNNNKTNNFNYFYSSEGVSGSDGSKETFPAS
jgi:hypothetical protein